VLGESTVHYLWQDRLVIYLIKLNLLMFDKYVKILIEGDVEYQPSVISDPEIKHFDLDGSEDYFIIGCDGLWETLDQNELCSFIYEQVVTSDDKDNLNVAELLVRKAQSNGSLDNITAIFVLLKDDLTQITNPKRDF